MSIKNGRSPALLFFFYCFSNVTVSGTSLSRRRFDSSRFMPGLLLELMRKPEIGEENSALLLTFLDASRMYDLYIYISCHAASTDLPDLLSPPVTIVHPSREVFQATSCIDTELLYIGSRWPSCLWSSMRRGLQE